MLVDTYHRPIDYLRLSVTDRCNLRCVYCLPEAHIRFTPVDQILSDGELVDLVSNFAELGFSKIRLTGGEPLLRPNLPQLIHRIAHLKGVQEVALSTNGLLLEKMAKECAEAGLTRVNISLDSLKAERFASITRFGTLDSVLQGLMAAVHAGLTPVKINVVVAKGMNEDEVADFVQLTKNHPLHIRFIELMPMGETGLFSKEKWVPLTEIIEKAHPLVPLPPEDRPVGYGPAVYYRRPGYQGSVGFISALSCGFCSSCNRVRLTAKGILHPCLDDSRGEDLGVLLRKGATREEIKRRIGEVVNQKPAQHHMLERIDEPMRNSRFMCQVGG